MQGAHGPANPGAIPEHMIGASQHLAVPGVVAGQIERVRIGEVDAVRAGGPGIDHALEQGQRLLQGRIGNRHAEHRQLPKRLLWGAVRHGLLLSVWVNRRISARIKSPDVHGVATGNHPSLIWAPRKTPDFVRFISVTC